MGVAVLPEILVHMKILMMVLLLIFCKYQIFENMAFKPVFL